MIFSGFFKSNLVNYPGYVASTVFTCGCNFRCPYCHNPEFVIKGSDETYFGETYTEEEILEHLQKRKGFLDALVVSGGEPTLHADLASFLRKVRAMGLKIKLDSNGSRPEVIASLINENLIDYVAMDLKAPLEKYHKVGFDNPKLIEESIKLLKTSKIDHEFRTTCPKGFFEEGDFAAMSKLVGNSPWYLQTFNPAKTLDPAYNNVSSYSKNELSDIISSLGLKNTDVR